MGADARRSFCRFRSVSSNVGKCADGFRRIPRGAPGRREWDIDISEVDVGIDGPAGGAFALLEDETADSPGGSFTSLVSGPEALRFLVNKPMFREEGRDDGPGVNESSRNERWFCDRHETGMMPV